MWRWILVNLLIFSSTSTQPIADDDRPRECCPCPKAPVPDLAASTSVRSDLVDDCPCRASVYVGNENGFARFGDQDQAGTAGNGAFVRMAGVDECPCRLRDADSAGAPSVFFPSAVRALWPVMSDKETKDNAKPLLHPEVGLASSVLETLRQATDEEYQEALARDAVRSVLQAPDVDVVSDVSSALDKARNIVDVLLKPNDMSYERVDDTNSEASHVQESRCVHPLGKSNNLNLRNPSTTVQDTFYTPTKVNLHHKNRNIWDMDSSVGASNIQEEIVDGTGKDLERLRSKSNPTMLNLFPSQSDNEANKQSNVKHFIMNKTLFTNLKSSSESSLDALNKHINNSLSDLKVKLDNHLQTVRTDNADKLKNVFDNVNSPSGTNFVLKPLLPTAKADITTMKPFPLKSLLKLKDVELIPPVTTLSTDLNKAKANVPKLLPSIKHNKESSADLFKNFKASDLGDLITNGLKISFKNRNDQRGTDNIQSIPKGIFKSGIVDAETSPSEIKMNVNQGLSGDNDCDNIEHRDSLKHENFNNSPTHKNTEVLEIIPIPTKIVKQNNEKNVPLSKIECDDESANDDINNISENIDKFSNTEIIDAIPSPSELKPREQINTQANKETLVDEAANDEENESSFFSNSEESNRDVNNANVENNEQTFEEINESQESDIKRRNEESKENCFKEAHNKLYSKSETNSHSENMARIEKELHSDLDSINNDGNTNKPCVDDTCDDNLKNIELTNPNKYNREKEENFTNAAKNNEEKSPSKALNIQDLQNMSDKLLDLSTKKDQESFASEKVECNALNDGKVLSNNLPDHTIDRVDDDTFDDSSIETAEESKDNVPETTNITESTGDNNDDTKQMTSCTPEFERKQNFVSNVRNEMKVDASEPFINKIVPSDEYKPRLLHNFLHPKPLGTPLNVLDLKLPSVDHINENLGNILKPKNDGKFSTTKENNLNDNSNTMLVEASAPKLKSALPTIQPWEDIDLDIFQLKPLTLSGPQDLLSKMPNLPRLNLNSFKGKLAIPKGLYLKPMKLESSLGDKNGLLGAKLTIGSNRGSFGKGSNLLTGPLSLHNLPTLEELRSNMRENAQNLLLTPLDITGKNLIDDSLRSSQTLSDNIRSHAKSTMKDIQQTIETTMKDVKQNDLGILSEPLKNPQEFFHAVSRTHEDVTDKLKAIHYDLNDRLESIRDRISDQSLLPTLNTPMARQSTLSFGPEKIKEKPFLLSTSYSQPQKKGIVKSKSKPQNNLKIGTSRNMSTKTKNHKMPAAPSIQVPKTVEAPKLKTITTSSPPPFISNKPSFRIPQLLTNKKSLADVLQEPVSHYRNSKIPILGRFKAAENKVKITFGSTTLKPDLPRKKPSLASRPPVSRKPPLPVKITNPIKSGASRVGSKLKPFDTNEAQSAMVPTKLKAPVKVEETEYERPVITSRKKLPVLPKPKSTLKSQPQVVDNKFTNGHAGRQFSSTGKSALGSPSEILPHSKTLGSDKLDILSSLREAVRARLSNITPITNDKIVQPDSSIQPDMLRSASENVESTLADGLMRENASYTCKMMCTRNN